MREYYRIKAGARAYRTTIWEYFRMFSCEGHPDFPHKQVFLFCPQTQADAVSDKWMDGFRSEARLVGMDVVSLDDHVFIVMPEGIPPIQLN